MPEFEDHEIAAEAYGLWQADGSPLWGHPVDHWLRAIDNLRRRAATGASEGARNGEEGTADQLPHPG
ncbi:DUF2934 domain-containing protein [Kaistia geumhonensis]|uniref:DUF2934 domain-containing protein n=1 Tax=Kaistia geumhonensis TaxID=410839 RepID=A0ABU0M9A4_9HYPH|nr:DUF2934 domain-containing protein [Kaistia geumhonensis]MCX5480755.1 DUF2934 domain-containing protein [Kaistia geumhonensis]MDQ0517541.1 hypothetical protein [Kaistia geumhonensis]